MSYQKVRLEMSGRIAVLTLDHAKTMNAISTGLQQEFRSALREVEDNQAVRALLLTGAGRGFCSGADLSSMQKAEEGETLGQGAARMMRELTNHLLLDMHQLRVPVVAAVNGVAAGAGASIALGADITIAARSAYFLLPFMANLGIVPDVGATWMLPRLVGPARARALTLLGERLPAERAVEWGMIWDCVDDDALMDEAMRLAERLASLPAHAALEVRRAFETADANDLPTQLDYEADRQEVLIDSDAFKEGLQAFLEKRKPNFK